MKQLIVCIPVALTTNYVERSAKANGDKPEDYSQLDCPDCSQPMWLGPRSKVMLDAGMQATCAVCAILVHNLRSAEGMTILTKPPEG